MSILCLTGHRGKVSFMATAISPFASTKETTNYARLCRLLVDVGSQVLRSTFDRIHPPATLHTVLGSTSVHYATLQSLYKGKKKVLNPTQWGKLYPTHSPVSSAAFDITLLTVLLRNICALSPPANGWDCLPLTTNISIADDIARVKYYRNTVYGIEAISVHCHKAVVPWGSESCRPRVGSTCSLREFFFITSVGSSAQESRIHSKMVLFGDNFKFSAAVSSWIPTVPSQSFFFSASGLERLVSRNVRCLDILGGPFWHNYLTDFFSDCNT